MKKKPSNDNNNAMWGGRFEGIPDDIMMHFNQSISVDHNLYKEDILGSAIHASMLLKQKIITAKEEQAIQKGLGQIFAEIESGAFDFKLELEDIHMNIEARLKEIIGEPASKLHTARSRNDQVALDFKLFIIEHATAFESLLTDFQECLIDKAEENINTIMPGFTHLQTAQPISLAHHLMAYVEMFQRDKDRFFDLIERHMYCPLGSAALAGTSHPIDRNFVAKEFDFYGATNNSIDSVASRDFALEYLSVLAIMAVNLSRLAEEIVLWSSQQFNFIRLSDAFSTGSSIMPQKRNPDSAELIRGKTGTVIGALTGLLVTMKGLPLAYNKDMQEDKKPVLSASVDMLMSVQVMAGIIATMEINKDKMLEDARRGFSTATDLADWLVRELKIPFRDAHHITGAIVKACESKGIRLDEMELKEMQKIEPRITKKVFDVLTVENSVQSKKSLGGTSPIQIKKAITKAREEYL